MVIDITWAYLSEFFRSSKDATEETSMLKWLEKYVGPKLDTPNIEVPPSGSSHRIDYCGDGWAIDMQFIKIPNPTPRHEHNVGICAPLGEWQQTITTTQYRLHLINDTLAVQFKLRWL